MTDDAQQLHHEPDPEAHPPAAPPPPAPEPPEPPEPESKIKHRRPANPKGWYQLLIGTRAGADQAVYFRECGWARANDDGQAKRILANDPETKPEIDAYAAGDGCWLRAVPARSWPKTEATKDQVTTRRVIG